MSHELCGSELFDGAILTLLGVFVGGILTWLNTRYQIKSHLKEIGRKHLSEVYERMYAAMSTRKVITLKHHADLISNAEKGSDSRTMLQTVSDYSARLDPTFGGFNEFKMLANMYADSLLDDIEELAATSKEYSRNLSEIVIPDDESLQIKKDLYEKANSIFEREIELCDKLMFRVTELAKNNYG